MTESADTTGAADSRDAQTKLADGTEPLRFGFRYLGKPFRATVTRGDGEARLAVHGHLGTLPFSAQSAEARAGILRMTKGGRSCLEIGPKQDVFIHGKCDLVLPLTVSGILAGAVEILIETRGRMVPVIEQLTLAEQAAAARVESDSAEDSSCPEVPASQVS